MSRTVVAITGASSGIGADFARMLAHEHDLLLIARRKDRLEELATELRRRFGTEVEVIQADLTHESDVELVAQKLAAQQELVLLVNNAGFGTKGRFWEAPLAGQEQMHKLHVMAPVRLTHAALQNMVPKDRGGVINVASVAAFVRTSGTVSYAATKSWMTVFTEGLYLELRAIGSNVVIQALCPGFTHSEFHEAMKVTGKPFAGSPLWMTAEEVVNASLDGLRSRKLFVVPGWRYRIFTTLFSKLPAGLRLALEAAASKRREQMLKLDADNSPRRIDN